MPYKDKEKGKEHHREYCIRYRAINKEKLKEKNQAYNLAHKKERKEYYEIHKDEIKEQSANYRLEHKQEEKERRAKYYIGHKEEIKKYRTRNKEKRKERNAKYYLEHKEKKKRQVIKRYHALDGRMKKQIKIYQLSHKEEINTYQREYRKQRRLANSLYKMKCNLRNMTAFAFKRIGLNKPTKTETLLGADFKTVMQHIESQFIWGMSWENYGKWHIDHKKPLAKAKTEKQLMKLCHYTNLQPLWKEENLSKQDKTDFVVKEVKFG